MTSRTSLIISGSSAEVGSSKSITFGSIASARAMATRCCWPPESWAGYLSAWSAMPTRSSSSIARCSASCLPTAAHLDRAERDVLQDRLVGEEVEALEHHADLGAQLGERLALLGQRLAVERDRALVDGLEPVDGAAQGRLAGAGRADHDDDLAALDGEVDVPRARAGHRTTCRRGRGRRGRSPCAVAARGPASSVVMQPRDLSSK